VRAVRVMCSATVSPHHILKAFQKGADGVLVGG
jgi:F420-non-reducing hydrogenase iron-sulfur subunit